MAYVPVVLVLGAGPRVGSSVAEKFASNGYKVAVASRSGTGSETAKGFLSLAADFTKPESIQALFEAVNAEFNTAPSVVVYNAAALTNPPDKESTLSIPAENVMLDLNVNTVSAYVAAQQAVVGWATLPKETKKSFIYTGNITNVAILPMPMMLDLGMGKSASAYWIGVADATYSAKGYRYVFQSTFAWPVSNISGLLDSFMPMSATEMVKSKEWLLMVLHMANSMHSWPTRRRRCRGTPRL